MNVFTTPGAFSWSELITPDPEGAKIFYSKLFGWSTRDRETPWSQGSGRVSTGPHLQWGP